MEQRWTRHRDKLQYSYIEKETKQLEMRTAEQDGVLLPLIPLSKVWYNIIYKHFSKVHGHKPKEPSQDRFHPVVLSGWGRNTG